jgi:hypothetical protein
MSSVPVKGDIVINPQTSRPIRVGGRTWSKLVKAGVFEGRYTSKPQESVINSVNVEQSEKKSVDDEYHLNVTPPKTETRPSTHRRRPYSSKRGKTQSPNPRRGKAKTRMSKNMAKLSAKVLSNNIDELIDSNNLSTTLERLILAEMDDDDDEIPPSPPKLVRQNRRRFDSGDVTDDSDISDDGEY